MGDFVPLLGNWIWWVVAGVLLFLELMAPGVFFIWLAAAAAAVGLLDISLNMGWQMELVAFAALALVSVLAGRSLLKKRHVLDSDLPNLNQRMFDYVGRTFSLHEPIVDGRGRIDIDGTLWEVRGPDAAKGTHMKVTGVEGLRLKVEPV
jgi:inner membrane protein